MITKYKIPCSTCGKLVERYVFCSGACRVKGHRGRTTYDTSVSIDQAKPEEIVKPITNEEQPQFSDKPKTGYHLVAYLGKYVKD